MFCSTLQIFEKTKQVLELQVLKPITKVEQAKLHMSVVNHW